VKEAVLMICIAVSRTEIMEKFNTGTERVKERRNS
jgi:hypothetical protein